MAWSQSLGVRQIYGRNRWYPDKSEKGKLHVHGYGTPTTFIIGSVNAWATSEERMTGPFHPLELARLEIVVLPIQPSVCPAGKSAASSIAACFMLGKSWANLRSTKVVLSFQDLDARSVSCPCRMLAFEPAYQLYR